MSTGRGVVLLVLNLVLLNSFGNVSFFSEETLRDMFVLKKAEGDCKGGELGGDFTKFKDISKNECASYCGLNKDCKGFSYAETAAKTGECILKSIGDCQARMPGVMKFYSKKI